MIEHGGNLAVAARLFPHAPQPWIDLSTGINPHSYPLFDLPATALTRLPEPARHQQLKRIASRAYDAPGPDHVIAAPGTQSMLPRIASLVKPGRALVLGPTYAEHARAAAMAGHATSETSDFKHLFNADLAVVVNPNNPDGRIVPRRGLLDLAASMRARSGMLVVDEAFGDVSEPGNSLAGDVEAGGLVVLRSFGKFFGLAGVRLGFAIASRKTVATIEAQLGPWAVSGTALEYGCHALADDAWRAETRTSLRAQAASLDEALSAAGIPPSGGTDLFRFVRHADAQAIFAHLGGQGILVRRFADRPDQIRIGLPHAEHRERVAAALRAWSASNLKAHQRGAA